MKQKMNITKLYLVLTVLCAGCFLVCTASGAESKTITFKSLLEEMVDRDYIARLPKPAYTCKQFSSYDRNSTEPGSPTWWANADRSFFIRIEDNDGRKEHVLMDIGGPGAVVRFWATWHGPGGGQFSNGTLRVYLDKNPEPVIEGPMADLISGGKLVGEPLSQGVSPETAYRHQGHNLYLPIPYAGHCKITYETKSFIDKGARKGEALYYQINYRTYEPGTKVESFTMNDLQQESSTLNRVQRMLGESKRTSLNNLNKDIMEGTIRPSEERNITINGKKVIRAMEFQLKADDLSQALRSTIIKIDFDGKNTVWCPVGDFFGTGYHIRPHSTWYTNVSKDNTLSCYWIMPFRKQAKISIHNLGSQPVKLTSGQILSDSWKWDKRSCYFHAAWKQWPDVKTQSNENAKDHGAFDLNWITVQGQGLFVGDVLTLFNTANTWWGEGDEKIYVDGEHFPSHIGTGTEDYYGYAWCKPNFFESAFHAQPSGDGNLKPGFSVNSRLRSLDAIPFQKSIKFDMELWHWAKTTMSYAPTTIWYARPGTKWDVKPDPKEAKRPIPRSVEDIIKPRLVKNAIEGETLKILECSGGSTEIQNIPNIGWSNNRQLWWKHAKENNRLVIEFEIEEAGNYDVTLGITKAVDYGIVSIAVNSETKLESIDLYNQSVIAMDVKLPPCRLNSGRNKLQVTILGANPSAVKNHMFGLDFILANKRAE
ncbi:MAG: glycoside hydrolase family 172 protein [Planctomycetota bacterium]